MSTPNIDAKTVEGFGDEWAAFDQTALDRFGTRLEQRFSRSEIRQMMERSGLRDIEFRDDVPYWVACGRRAG